MRQCALGPARLFKHHVANNSAQECGIRPGVQTGANAPVKRGLTTLAPLGSVAFPGNPSPRQVLLFNRAQLSLDGDD